MVFAGIASVLGFFLMTFDSLSWANGRVSFLSALLLFSWGALIGSVGGLVDHSMRKMWWSAVVAGMAVPATVWLSWYLVPGEGGFVLVFLPILPALMACSCALGISIGQVGAGSHSATEDAGKVLFNITARMLICVIIVLAIWACGVTEGWYQFKPRWGARGWLHPVLGWFAIGAACYALERSKQSDANSKKFSQAVP